MARYEQDDEYVEDGQETPSFFRLPLAVRRIFDIFPLKCLPANDLPRRSPRDEDVNVLHIFTTGAAAADEAPSFNPACLKWQVCNDALFNDTALTYLGVS